MPGLGAWLMEEPDEDYLGFGLTGEMAGLIAENLDTLSLKAPNVPIPYSRPLEQFVIPQVDHIVKAAQALMNTLIMTQQAA